MAKDKFYVVWSGRKCGIFDNWEDCLEQISAFPEAKYKSFKTLAMAEMAYKRPYAEFIGKDVFETRLTEEELKLIGKPILESISVDGAWNTATGIIEYQGVETSSKRVIFRCGPYEDGTNNIAEFLALVHALALCKKNGINLPIYSDSRNAIAWVYSKEARTKLEPSTKNAKLFELLNRATKWLKENTYTNKILKWETEAWGENPADFGRK